MALFLQDHRAARDVVVATIATAVVAESWVTYPGHSAAGMSRAGRLRNVAESVLTALVPRKRGSTVTVDRARSGSWYLGRSLAVWSQSRSQAAFQRLGGARTTGSA